MSISLRYFTSTNQTDMKIKTLLFATIIFAGCNSPEIQKYKAKSKDGELTLIVTERFNLSPNPNYNVGDTVNIDEYHWVGGYGKAIGKYILVKKLDQY